jgi:quinol monooxygenase YgiN
MILILATVEAKPDEAAQLVEAFQAYAKLVRQHEPQTLRFDICRQQDEPGQESAKFVYVECFEDDAALIAHNGQSYREECLAKIRQHVLAASAKQFVSRAWQ